MDHDKNNHPQDSNQQSLTYKKKRMYDFMRQNPTGVLSSVTPDGDPHGTVIYYVVGEDLTITFLTKAKTQKYTNIQHANRVALTVLEPLTQTTVQVFGTATEITDNVEINQIAQAILGISLRTSNGEAPPISKLDAGEAVAFRVKPIRASMAIFGARTGNGYRDIFESIEFLEVEK